jgi:hypothetical protein
MEDRNIRSGDSALPALVMMCRQYILGMPDLGHGRRLSIRITARRLSDGLQGVIWGQPPKLHGRPLLTSVLKPGFLLVYRGKVPPPLSQALYIAWFVEFLTNHRRTLAPQERDAFDDAGRRLVHRRVARLTSSQLMLPSAVAPSPLVQQGSYVHLTGTNVLLPPLPNGVSQEQGQLTRKVQGGFAQDDTDSSPQDWAAISSYCMKGVLTKYTLPGWGFTGAA